MRSTIPPTSRKTASRYHARDMAVVRASIAQIPIVLASATPSVETRGQCAQRGRYRRLHLPDAIRRPAAAGHRSDRYAQREGPPRGRFIAPRLAEAVKATLERGEQALLFLNRRGYAPLTLCRNCGHRLRARTCDAWLVEHRFRRRLVCHHCGFADAAARTCARSAAAEDLLAAVRAGRRATCRRSRRRCFRMRGSSFSPAIWSESVERLRERTREMRSGRFDIIIGTQLVAKGHNFPKLTLVGVVDADLGWPTAIRAPPSAHFSCSIRSRGAPGAKRATGAAFCRPISPSIR